MEESLRSRRLFHILLIEDDEGIRCMLETRLCHSGYVVSVAATGRHGLQKIRSGQQIDLILCDMKMPGMSGIELFREYAGLAGKAPFVLMTGYPDRQKILQAIQLGVRDVLLKPIKNTELIERIRAFLGNPCDNSGNSSSEAA